MSTSTTKNGIPAAENSNKQIDSEFSNLISNDGFDEWGRYFHKLVVDFFQSSVF